MQIYHLTCLYLIVVVIVVFLNLINEFLLIEYKKCILLEERERDNK